MFPARLAATMRAVMQRADFEFDLPKHLIAQTPAERRSGSRLLCMDGSTGRFEDRQFTDLVTLLQPGDLLVFNDTRVVPARVFGTKSSGGRVEVLLERVVDSLRAWVHLRASKALRPGGVLLLPGGNSARLIERDEDLFLLEFSSPVFDFFEAHGRIPLPPYITREPTPADLHRYQTVYANERGAIAAPTAGLHFDSELLAALAARGVASAFVTLHVGAGTFAPVREQDLDAHRMHREHFRVPGETVAAVEATRTVGGRVIAVGTTAVRSLESASANGGLVAQQGDTQLFIRPGYRFRSIDALITNFHLPGSTLLMLCAALVGRENLLGAYGHAIGAEYRFFSYGDAMFLTPRSDALHRP